MIDIIKLEIKMFFINKKNLSILIFLTALLLLFIKIKMDYNQDVTENYQMSINAEMSSIQDALKKLKYDLKNMPDNKDLSNLIEDYERDYNLLTDISYAISSKNYKMYLEKRIKSDEYFLDGINSGKYLTNYSVRDLEHEMNINKILLEKNIQPISTMYCTQTLNFITLLFQEEFVIAIILSVIFFSSSIISGDFDKQTYKLLYTQPIKINRIYCGKLIAALMINYFFVFSLIILGMGVTAIFSGIGNFNYPIKIYLNNIESYTTIAIFDIMLIMLLILLIACIVVLTLFISVLIKNSNLTMFILILIIFASNFIGNIKEFWIIAQINPFTYINLTEVLNGNSAFIMSNSNISINNAFLFLPSLCSVLIIISLFRLNKIKFSR